MTSNGNLKCFVRTLCPGCGKEYMAEYPLDSPLVDLATFWPGDIDVIPCPECDAKTYLLFGDVYTELLEEDCMEEAFDLVAIAREAFEVCENGL